NLPLILTCLPLTHLLPVLTFLQSQNRWRIMTNIEGTCYSRRGVSTLVYPVPTAGASPDIRIKRRLPQASKGIPCGLLHNEAARDIERLHQNEGVPILPDRVAKDWLYLQPVLFNTWGDMKRTFLEKFFLTSRTVSIRKEIDGIRQHTRETLHEYWERFNKLYATCPHHQISEQLLIQYFYEGLSMMDRSMIDTTSGGALMDKTPAAARHLISNMASNTQQFGIRGPSQTRMLETGESVNRIDIIGEIASSVCTQPKPNRNNLSRDHLGLLFDALKTSLIKQHQPATTANVCGICTFMEHPTDMCPTLQEIESDQTENPTTWETAIAARTESGTIRSSTIRIHTEHLSEASRLSTADSAIPSTTFPTTTAESAYPRQLSISRRPNEATCNQQYGSVSSSNLPSQTISNLRGNASAVTLRSNKELPQPAQHQMSKSVKADPEAIADSQLHPKAIVLLPFPSQIISARKPDSDKELLKMFRKVEINNPLLDAIKQIPKYAKFLKELCVHKRRKMKGSQELGDVVLTLTKNDSTAGTSQVLPKKCRDLGIFSVSCTIGECTFVDAMLDLGASINVMPASTYRSLNFEDLEPTGMTIQLANRSIVQSLGVLEDVLIQVNELIFSTDFYVLDMEDETSGKESTLILGRPFLMTARTKIDVHIGTLSMEFGDTLVQFNIFEAMKHPTEDHYLFGINLLDDIVEEYLQLN
ncbi:hypothetical protein CR513_23689, partial [Mucuna pruriens]